MAWRRMESTLQPLVLLPPLVFVLVNFCYMAFLDFPFSTVTLLYVLVLEFAAIGLSFQIAELITASTLGEILPARVAILHDSPPVALLCVTCDDTDPALLRLLKGQTYPNLKVFVLDDSSSEIHQSTVDDSGLLVLRRSSRKGYKAGNLNHWLRHHGDQFKYFAVADADSILPVDFIESMVHHAEHPANRDIAILESQKLKGGSSLLLTLSSAPAICSSHGSTLAHRIPRRLLPRHEPGTGSQQHLPR